MTERSLVQQAIELPPCQQAGVTLHRLWEGLRELQSTVKSSVPCPGSTGNCSLEELEHAPLPLPKRIVQEQIAQFEKLEPQQQRVLAALAVIGGEASIRLVALVIGAAEALVIAAHALCQRLCRCGQQQRKRWQKLLR